jgi:TonB family protein
LTLEHLPYMFQPPKRGSRTQSAWLTASFLFHCIFLFLLLHRSPIFVKPSSVAWGLHGQSEHLIYFPRANSEQEPDSKPPVLQLKAKRKVPKKPESMVESTRVGVPTGSLFQGPAAGTEARPALPIVFPDPEINPGQLPQGMQGDVIVEVTIDEQGSVTETRVLQSLERKIDEKVLATLRGWRFKPATVDGVAISSRQDVHFHFPS